MEVVALVKAPVRPFEDDLRGSPTITKMIYVDATRKVQRDAVDKLGFLFDE